MAATPSSAGTQSQAATGGLLARLGGPAVAIAALEFAVIGLLVDRFHLENQAFRTAVWIALLAFPVHHLLPRHLRLPCFAALSMLGTAAILGLEAGGFRLGQALARALPLFGTGLALIALAYLPVRPRVRVLLLLLAAGALALMRAGVLPAPWLDALWPVLAAMFMFRLIVLVYDRLGDPAPERASRPLAYFFMLPNVAFPLFPVIDAKAFKRHHYDAPAGEIYQRGAEWMMRGIVHLLLWRLVYYQVYLDPSRVRDGAQVAQYVVANLLLYLRVSGQFHFVIGLLHMFGFRLPETNHRYFLASSFTDYWRRINIPWKDFIVKVFHRPVALRLKGLGVVPSALIATAVAFLATWLLHSYQWFWLRGTFPLEATDMIFWGALGVLVAVNSALELRRPRGKRLKPRMPTAGESAALAARAAGTFATLALLWSLWSCESVGEWLALARMADAATAAWLGLVVTGIAAAAAIEQRLDVRRSLRGEAGPRAVGLLWAPARACFVPAALLVALSSASVERSLGPTATTWIRSMGDTSPNKSDEEFLVKGYYEDLMDVSRFNSLLNETYMSEPADWVRFEDSEIVTRASGSFLVKQLSAGREAVVNGVPMRINASGMRDRDYPLAREPGTFRIALLGSSILMGWGVADGETFESLLEERLNREATEEAAGRFELLNFGVQGYSATSSWLHLRDHALPFDPDAVVFVAHAEDELLSVQRLSEALRLGVPLPDPYLAQLGARAGVGSGTPERWAGRRLAPHLPELLAWEYGRFVEECRRAGIEPLWVFVPTVGKAGLAVAAERMRRSAEAAGFRTLVLEDVYTGPSDSLILAPWDRHPNARGHAMIADALFAALTRREPGGATLLADLRAHRTRRKA